MQRYRARKQEHARFATVVGALAGVGGNIESSEFKVEIMTFINTLCNTGPTVDDRVMVR